MPRTAYADEYPWIRCSCEYLLNSDSHGKPCPGCGETQTKEQCQFLDRFGSLASVFTVKYGITYRAVPYEDAYRR